MHYRCTVLPTSKYVVILKFMGLDHTYKVNDYFFLMDKKRSIFIVNFFDHIQEKGHGRNVMMGFSVSMNPALPDITERTPSKNIVCLHFRVSLLTFSGIKLRFPIMKMFLFFYPSKRISMNFKMTTWKYCTSIVHELRLRMHAIFKWVNR